MKLPNAEQAFVDIEKLRDYCLSEAHPRGKHKARVFLTALGLNAEDANELRDILLKSVQSENALSGEQDEYGQRFSVDVLIKRHGKEAVVRSAWIIRRGESMPRLTSCYVG